MQELTYDLPGGVIAAVLFVSTALAVEIGYRLGARMAYQTEEAMRAHVRTIQGAILGILAIVLGFTLSLALQRYDSRCEAVVAEANAIGTAYLRAQLLPAGVKENALGGLRAYVDLRVEAGRATLADHGARQAGERDTAAAQAALWDIARRAVAFDPAPVTSGLFVQAVNDAIDSASRREAALDRHVPQAVLILLYACLLLAGGIVGYTTGIEGHRPSLAGYLLAALIVVLVFITLDLDRPRRGFVHVSQKPLLDLQAQVHSRENAANASAR